MKVLLNEKVLNYSDEPFVFKESVDPRTGEKKVRLRGLLLPFNQVSRNGVLYNLDSIKKHYQELLGRSFCYNHQVDSSTDKSYGHVTESLLIENNDAVPKGWEAVYSKPGWYYEVDIDPEEKDMIRKLKRGDYRHVSIQLVGDSVEERYTEEFGEYQEAYVGDVIEMSAVIAPGFLATTAVFAEALKKAKAHKEDVSTSTAAGAIQPTQDLEKEELSPCQKWLKALDHAPTDEEVHKWAEDNKMDVHEVEAQIYKLAKQHLDMGHAETKKQEIVEPLPEAEADPKELAIGIKVEMEHTDNPEEAKKIALQHLAEVKDYYTKLKTYVESFRVTCEKPDGTKIIKTFEDEKQLAKFQANNPHLVIVKKVKERVGAQPTQPLMEDDINVDEEIKEFMQLGNAKVETIIQDCNCF